MGFLFLHKFKNGLNFFLVIMYKEESSLSFKKWAGFAWSSKKEKYFFICKPNRLHTETPEIQLRMELYSAIFRMEQQFNEIRIRIFLFFFFLVVFILPYDITFSECVFSTAYSKMLISIMNNVLRNVFGIASLCIVFDHPICIFLFLYSVYQGKENGDLLGSCLCKTYFLLI